MDEVKPGQRTREFSHKLLTNKEDENEDKNNTGWKHCVNEEGIGLCCNGTRGNRKCAGLAAFIKSRRCEISLERPVLFQLQFSLSG